jgi:phosphoribosylaminoimidazolecarboxamide formyltransferase/IMP cyclohydrolase
MNQITIRRALISVSDKQGITDFARRLSELGVDIISTGGTLKTLQEAGVRARSISEVTGFPEILDGRVKTLHPKIHGGLLAIADEPAHMAQLREHDITEIDMVVVNLYPFEQTIAAGNVALDDAVEQIDIGGPTMLRSAAKNFRFKTVIVNPARYAAVLDEMAASGGSVGEATRFALAREVFLHTSRYDSVISGYLAGVAGGSDTLPEAFSLALPKAEAMRYGENPHQQAALYGSFHTVFQTLHGKELSYNNIVDIQAAVELLEEFDEPTVVIIKHTNPCGVGSGASLAEAYQKAFATDQKSAFGGIIAVNRPLTMDAAEQMDKIFTEVIIAPSFPAEVLAFLKKKKDRRLIRQDAPLKERRGLQVKTVAGGVLVQTPDDLTLREETLKVATKRAPTEAERAALLFAWRVAKHVKSNAIVYALADRTIGVGAGQMSRFDSSRIAVLKAAEAGLSVTGTVVASDAFFPFADGLLEAVKAGATAVIQPGGSVRDAEVIAAADEHQIAMLFTGIRHFRH